jgi:hypothetical protein
MNFKQFIENEIEIVPFKYLFKSGMTGASVDERKPVVQCQEKIGRIDPGELAILLDEGDDWVIVAVVAGTFGFQAYKTPKNFWKKTGRWFVGSVEEFQKLGKEESEVYGIKELEPLVAEAKKRYGKYITGVFWTEQSLAIVFFTKPEGPGGYRSKYRLLVKSERPQLFTITLVIKGQSRTLNASWEEIPNAFAGAIQYITSQR